MPGNKCIINYCKVKGSLKSNIKMHNFPWKDKKRLQQWVTFVQEAGSDVEKIFSSSRLCGQHFENGCQGKDMVPQSLSQLHVKAIQLAFIAHSWFYSDVGIIVVKPPCNDTTPLSTRASSLGKSRSEGDHSVIHGTCEM